MKTAATVRGRHRSLFQLRLRLAVLRHFLSDVACGRLSFRRYILLLRRFALFLSRLQHNKFIRFGRGIRLDLYVPSFPSPAFYTAAAKFMTFDAKPPCTTALVSVTSACRFSCPHCYQRLDRGHDVSLDLLLSAIRKMQDSGVAFFNVEGGEPFLVYDRLKRVCATIDRRSEVWVNSTGDGITSERLAGLKALNLTAVMFSLHAADPRQINTFMGSDRAWSDLTRGVELCHQAEIPVAFNTCLTREAFHNGEFERVMDRARDLGGCLVQLIHPKPAGAWLKTDTLRFSSQDFQRAKSLVHQYNHHPEYASYPAIAAQLIEEDAEHFGCTAGGTDRFYLNAKGDVQPCEFLNLSFGNIAEENFEVIYDRMRAAFSTPCETWLCEECAPQIRQIMMDRAVTRLPLDPAQSSQICERWDRGRSTALYAQIESLK